MSIDPEVTHRIIGTEAQVEDDSGLVVRPDGVYEDLAVRPALRPGWFRDAHPDGRPPVYRLPEGLGDRAAGGQRLHGRAAAGKAGYLGGLRATTHHSAFDLLRPLCREVVTAGRIVDEGRVVTAGGVASALDLGLYLVEKYWGQAGAGAHRRPDGVPCLLGRLVHSSQRDFPWKTGNAERRVSSRAWRSSASAWPAPAARSASKNPV